jgi:hypothetical protein
MTTIKRGRGRPPGSKNRTPPPAGNGASIPVSAGAESSGSSSPAGSTRAGLEADRDRLLKGIAECSLVSPDGEKTITDWKTVAALQSQLNGVTRMLLRISGETAPTDTNMIRSPQFGRFMAQLCDVLSKKHPAAWLDVQALAAAEAR